MRMVKKYQKCKVHGEIAVAGYTGLAMTVIARSRRQPSNLRKNVTTLNQNWTVILILILVLPLCLGILTAGCFSKESQLENKTTGLKSKSFSLECRTHQISEPPQNPHVFKSESFRLEQVKEKDISRSKNFRLEKQ